MQANPLRCNQMLQPLPYDEINKIIFVIKNGASSSVFACGKSTFPCLGEG